MCVRVCVCVYKKDLALNSLQGLRCHKTKPNQAKLFYAKRMRDFVLHVFKFVFFCVVSEYF